MPCAPYITPDTALEIVCVVLTYTSTGVRPPWVTEQQTAPAKAKREYRATPDSFLGSAAASTFCLMLSSFDEPVDVGGAVAVPLIVKVLIGGRLQGLRRNSRSRRRESGAV